MGCGVLGVVLVLLLGTTIASHDRLVQLNEDVEAAWSQLRSAYRLRQDFALDVSVLEGVADQEALVALEIAVRKANQVHAETSPGEDQLRRFEERQRDVSDALEQLLDDGKREAHEDLEAQLHGIDRRIELARERFNAATLAYNKTRRRFPTLIIAFVAGLPDRPYFDEVVTR